MSRSSSRRWPSYRPSGPAATSSGRRPVLVRTDGAGATHRFAQHLHDAGSRVLPGVHPRRGIPRPAAGGAGPGVDPAYNADGEARDGAWVAELTGLVDLTGWPDGARLIVRRERPHPGAQLRFTDADGHRFTAFLTNTDSGQLADLELRHRRHARVEDRIRTGKDTGLRNLPYHQAAQNKVWLELIALAQDLLAHTQRLALTGAHRTAEPKTPALPAVPHPRPARPHRPPHPATAVPDLALGEPARRRPHPPDRPTRPIAGSPPAPTSRHTRDPWNPRPPDATAGPPPRPHPETGPPEDHRRTT